jgi:hypothetical protein
MSISSTQLSLTPPVYGLWEALFNGMTGLPEAVADIKNAKNLGIKDPKVISNIFAKTVSGASSVMYWVSYPINRWPMLVHFLNDYCPRIAPLLISIINALNNPSAALHHFLTITRFIDLFGGAANLFRITNEVITLYLIDRLFQVFKSQSNAQGQEKNIQILRSLAREYENNPLALQFVLPQWLYYEILAKGGTGYFNELANQIEAGDPAKNQEAGKLLTQMTSYARKKQIIHFLGIAAGFIGVVGATLSFLAFAITCPHIVFTILLIVSISIVLSIYLVRNGYVENKDGGFSFEKCVPLFIRDWFTFFKVFDLKWQTTETRQALVQLNELKNSNPGLLPRVLPQHLYQEKTMPLEGSSIRHLIQNNWIEKPDAEDRKNALVSDFYAFYQKKGTITEHEFIQKLITIRQTKSDWLKSHLPENVYDQVMSADLKRDGIDALVDKLNSAEGVAAQAAVNEAYSLLAEVHQEAKKKAMLTAVFSFSLIVLLGIGLAAGTSNALPLDITSATLGAVSLASVIGSTIVSRGALENKDKGFSFKKAFLPQMTQNWLIQREKDNAWKRKLVFSARSFDMVDDRLERILAAQGLARLKTA